MDYNAVFTDQWLEAHFPLARTDAFFEALFDGAEEGAYDIRLRFVTANTEQADFIYELTQRSGKCLVCSLTYGLPQVFSRHPIINVKGTAAAVAEALGKNPAGVRFELGATQEISSALHRIPLRIFL